MYLSKPALLYGLTFNCVKFQMKYLPLSEGGGPDKVLRLLGLGATVGVVFPTALPVLFRAGFTFGLAGNRRIGAVLALARFLGNSYLLPAELPPVLLSFGCLASGPFVFPPLFGRLCDLWCTGFLVLRARCPLFWEWILPVFGFRYSFGDFLFGFVSLSDGYD